MSGLIITLKDVVYDTGKKYYMDKSVNKGTRSLFDMAETTTGGGKDLSAGAVINDLTYNANTGAFQLAKTFDSAKKGMVYSGVKNDGFDLDANSCMKVSDKHWMFTSWLKINLAGTVSSFNNQILHFSTAPTNGANTALLSLVPTLNSAGTPTTIELAVRGKNYVLSSQLLPLFDGARHQFAVECSLNADGTSQTVKVYIDKVLVYSKTAAAAETAPGEPTNRRIGTTNSLPLAWNGLLYRVRVDDLSTSGVTADDVLSADYNLCSSRFS